jgi:hypothetical protein
MIPCCVAEGEKLLALLQSCRSSGHGCMAGPITHDCCLRRPALGKNGRSINNESATGRRGHQLHARVLGQREV